MSDTAIKNKFNGHSPTTPFAQPGDIFFARGTATLGKLIRWAERSKNESESWANHVGAITERGYLVPPSRRAMGALAKASEALWHIEENVWWHRHNHEQGYAVALFTPRNYNGDEGVGRAVSDWRGRTGNGYGWWRLTTFLGEKLTHGAIPFTRLHFQKRRIVCSNHVALGLAKDGITFGGQDPNELDPDELMDYCISHPEEFRFNGWCVVPGIPPH